MRSCWCYRVSGCRGTGPAQGRAARPLTSLGNTIMRRGDDRGQGRGQPTLCHRYTEATVPALDGPRTCYCSLGSTTMRLIDAHGQAGMCTCVGARGADTGARPVLAGVVASARHRCSAGRPHSHQQLTRQPPLDARHHPSASRHGQAIIAGARSVGGGKRLAGSRAIRHQLDSNAR